MTIEIGSYDGPETRRVIKAGHQEALPVPLRARSRLLDSTSSTVHVLAFEILKQLPAFHMLDAARRSGVLRPGQVVVDTSSGTFGLGLARVSQTMGHPCLIASDRAITADLKDAIEARGAQIVFVDAPVNATNVQEMRKNLRDELARDCGGFVPDQYNNPANPESYRAAAEIACAAIGHVDVLVTTVGSGGHSRGLAALRAVNPALKIVAVDTFGSVLFGLPPGQRNLRGLGNGLMPANVDHAIYNAVHWVTEDVALEGVLRIEEAGLGQRGLTAGAAWMVAEFIAATTASASILTVFPDLGWRYREQVSAFRLRRDSLVPPSVTSISRLSDAREPWCWFPWGRRTLAEVKGQQAALSGSKPS